MEREAKVGSSTMKCRGDSSAERLQGCLFPQLRPQELRGIVTTFTGHFSSQAWPRALGCLSAGQMKRKVELEKELGAGQVLQS